MIIKRINLKSRRFMIKPKKKIQDPNPYHGTGFYNFEN
jgi:hypothetical protein